MNGAAERNLLMTLPKFLNIAPMPLRSLPRLENFQLPCPTNTGKNLRLSPRHKYRFVIVAFGGFNTFLIASQLEEFFRVREPTNQSEERAPGGLDSRGEAGGWKSRRFAGGHSSVSELFDTIEGLLFSCTRTE